MDGPWLDARELPRQKSPLLFLFNREEHAAVPHDYPFAFSEPPKAASPGKDISSLAIASRSVELVPGASIDVRITVGPDGDLSLALI